MSFKVSQLLIVATVLLVVSVTTQAQEHEAKVFSVRLGDKVIVLPPPEGFEEVSSKFESMKTRFTQLEAPDADMLGAFLPTSDCELLRNGNPPTLAYYSKVSVLRSIREDGVSESVFNEAVDYFNKNQQSLLAPDGSEMEKVLKHLEESLTKLESQKTKLDMTQPKQLGVLESRPNLHSSLLLMSMNFDFEGKKTEVPLLVAMSFVRVKERIIYAITYRLYQARTDLEILKQLQKKWTDSILTAN